MAAESFDPSLGNKFSVYAISSIKSGLYRYMDLRNKLKRYVPTDFETTDTHNEGYSYQLEYLPEEDFKTIQWEDIEFLFDLTKMSSQEEQVIFYYYKQKYSYQETGEIMGLTKQRIKKICNNVIEKLRLAAKSNGVKYEDFLM
jgi:RNA polymerase sigma factor (sigma-70 family)